jgi:2-polyprenyl-3-methyl-5-hydroxy-6-metoxy-1,4-benzoquinol methylase
MRSSSKRRIRGRASRNVIQGGVTSPRHIQGTAVADYSEYLERISSPGMFERKCDYLRHNFARFFGPGNRVLEIGPGRGEFLFFAREKGCAFVDVVDRDKGVLEYVREDPIVRHRWQCSAEKIDDLKGDLGEYDRIFLLQVMEHIETQHLQEFLKSLYNRLAPGGKILITVPNGANPLSIVERYSDITHHNLFSENSLRELVELTGLPGASTEVQGYRIPPNGIINVTRIFLQWGLHLLLKALLVVNGGVYFSIYQPNVTLIVTREG